LRDENSSGYQNYELTGGAATTRRVGWNSGAGSLALHTPDSIIELYVGAGGSGINFAPNGWGGDDAHTRIYGNNGADSLYVNFAELDSVSAASASVVFYGGGGNDTFQVDDSASTGVAMQSYDIYDDRIIQFGVGHVYFDSAVETVGLVGSQSSQREYALRDSGSADLYLTGGNANDEFLSLESSWRSVVIDGRGGVDSLYVDDDYLLEPNALPFRALLGPTLLTRDRGTIFDYYRMNMQVLGIESATYEAAPNTDRFEVYGTSSGSAAVWSILCGVGNDIVTIHPHDTAGNLTINGDVGISGGSGIDTVTINDVGSSTPIAYRFHNDFGPITTHVSGLGNARFGAASDFESMIVRAGDANDSFQIDTFKSGSGLQLYGNGGDDALDVTPVSKNLADGITNLPAFAYDGGTGNDRFALYNDNSPSAWSYQWTNSGVRADRVGGATYFLFFFYGGVEHSYASGGLQNDAFYVEQTRPGATTALHGAGGSDFYLLGRDQRTDEIRGAVFVSGAGGSDSISIDDRADTIGRTFHISADGFVGAAPGDDLFGPGGFVQFEQVTGSLTVRCGSGDDTAFVVPHPITPITIDLGAQSFTETDDFAGFAFAGAADPVLVPNGPGGGTYTFSNRAPLTYLDAEETTIDDVAPAVLSSEFEVDTARQQVQIAFSEDVSTSLTVTHLQVLNLATNEPVPPNFMDVTYNPAENSAQFRFPGYENGVLPDGSYQATLSGAVTDLFGNAIGADSVLEFFFLQGDATRDGRVNLEDFNRLAANFGQTDRTFSQGDFDYDGAVGLSDFNLLAGQFGIILAPAASWSGLGNHTMVDPDSADEILRDLA
jgi:hypothetical protein